MISYPLPVLGFCAFSGTGKTTLLTQLIPLLKCTGLRIGMVKHAHHDFDVDYPGKDSYRLRQAGADQMLIASRGRVAWVEEFPQRNSEPTLADVLATLDPGRLDLVLVEGFKRERIPKIEIHRPRLGTPLIYPGDTSVIAIASDTPLIGSQPDAIVKLDLNRPEQIARFIRQWMDATMVDGHVGRIRLIR